MVRRNPKRAGGDPDLCISRPGWQTAEFGLSVTVSRHRTFARPYPTTASRRPENLDQEFRNLNPIKRGTLA
jgi:hypothetical protein